MINALKLNFAKVERIDGAYAYVYEFSISNLLNSIPLLLIFISLLFMMIMSLLTAIKFKKIHALIYLGSIILFLILISFPNTQVAEYMVLRFGRLRTVIFVDWLNKGKYYILKYIPPIIAGITITIRLILELKNPNKGNES